MLYGAAQTINSANYVFVNTFAELSSLRSPAASAIFVGEFTKVTSLKCVLVISQAGCKIYNVGKLSGCIRNITLLPNNRRVYDDD